MKGIGCHFSLSSLSLKKDILLLRVYVLFYDQPKDVEYQAKKSMNTAL
jgi:hypothetical protein